VADQKQCTSGKLLRLLLLLPPLISLNGTSATFLALSASCSSSLLVLADCIHGNDETFELQILKMRALLYACFTRQLPLCGNCQSSF